MSENIVNLNRRQFQALIDRVARARDSLSSCAGTIEEICSESETLFRVVALLEGATLARPSAELERERRSMLASCAQTAQFRTTQLRQLRDAAKRDKDRAELALRVALTVSRTLPALPVPDTSALVAALVDELLPVELPWTCVTCCRRGTGATPARCPSCGSDRDDRHGPHAGDVDVSRFHELAGGAA